MSLDHSHAPMPPRLRLRLWLLMRLEAVLLPLRRSNSGVARVLAWIDEEYAHIHREIHRDG